MILRLSATFGRRLRLGSWSEADHFRTAKECSIRSGQSPEQRKGD